MAVGKGFDCERDVGLIGGAIEAGDPALIAGGIVINGGELSIAIQGEGTRDINITRRAERRAGPEALITARAVTLHPRLLDLGMAKPRRA